MIDTKNLLRIPRRTAEEMEIAVKLGRIFTPQASRAISSAFERQGAKHEAGCYLRFAHYTTAEAALNILRTKTLFLVWLISHLLIV